MQLVISVKKQKKQNQNWSMGSVYKMADKMALTPLQLKKNGLIYRAHGIQIDRLNPTVSMQKSVLKNMHRVLR